MRMAIAIMLMFAGACWVYVSAHGITSALPGFYAIWQEVLSGLDGDKTSGG